MLKSKSTAKRHKLEAQITKLLQDYEKGFPDNRLFSFEQNKWFFRTQTEAGDKGKPGTAGRRIGKYDHKVGRGDEAFVQPSLFLPPMWSYSQRQA